MSTRKDFMFQIKDVGHIKLKDQKITVVDGLILSGFIHIGSVVTDKNGAQYKCMGLPMGARNHEKKVSNLSTICLEKIGLQEHDDLKCGDILEIIV